MAKDKAGEVLKPGSGDRTEVEIQGPGKQPTAARAEALRRMAEGYGVSALARELGVHRNSLYYWRAVQEGRRKKKEGNPREQALASQIAKLEQALGRKSLELDFFAGALRRVGEKRARSKATGEIASTTRSGKEPQPEVKD